MDPLVKISSVKDVVALDPVTLAPTGIKVVTFMVGEQGPFILKYKPGEYTAERVHVDMQKEVDTLRALRAIPPA